MNAIHQERMVLVKHYTYFQFYCVHIFRELPQILMYSSYRKTKVHDGIVDDMGHWHGGFQDITVLDLEARFILLMREKPWKSVCTA
jgi:hypothetical protein